MTNSTDASNTAALLARWSGGDREALDQLLTHLYGEIHAIAVRELRSERHLTIRPTALVHEAYLRLAGLNELRLQDRAHFMSMAARVTRQALVDEARRFRADKRDGGTPVTLSDANLGASDLGYDALDVDTLLTELQRYDEIAAEIVSMRVFGGMSVEEAAEALSLSTATVNRRWVTGKAWLARELTRGA
jgi:RNA polymerase sigma factor (TIGR02999 family)